MNTSIYIAKRYLLSTKTMHAINIISGISMMGVLIGTAALIILLSVFNGLEKSIVSLYSNFSPEIRVQATLGKTFNPDQPQFKALRKDSRLISCTEVLQDKVVVQYREKTYIATIRGVTDDFLKNPLLDSIVRDGSFTLHLDDRPMAVIGAFVYENLGVNIHDPMSAMEIYAPKRGSTIAINPGDEFITRSIAPSGVFSVQQDFDDMVITPLDFTRKLFDEPVNISSIDLNYKPNTNLEEVQTELQKKVGNRFTVKTRSEQNTALYKTLNFEKWAVFMILAFVVIIAAFNIIGSLTILVIEKRKDIAILTSLGANKQLIRGIFFFEGMMISLAGCIIGIVLGFVFSILQQTYGFIKFTDNKLVANNAYPIVLKLSDFGLVFLTVTIISVIASAISAGLSVKGLDDIKQDL